MGWCGVVTPTRTSFLAKIAVILLPVGWAVARVLRSQNGSPLSVPVGSMLLLVLIAVAVLATAWPVRRWTTGGVRSGFFTPLRAARAAVMAKAASHCGAVLLGWWAGHAVFLLPDLAIESLRSAFWRLVVGMLLALGVIVAGLVAERWCRLPEGDNDPHLRSPRTDPELS